jgi:hypothetical protein
MHRIAVKFKNQPLMPMKSSRVSKYITQKKGKIRYDRKLKLHYLQLFKAPSDFKTQPIIIGIDPGSYFDGISVVSKRNHHCNFELIQRTKKGKSAIKAFMQRKAENRRIRRSRLWHRPIRFSNRTSTKLTPTIRANVEFRQWIITKLMQIYPISKIAVEDVRFNHYASNRGASFSQAEQGKTKLYDFIRERAELELIDGFETHQLRTAVFGYDPKLKDKGSKKFEAHCIDSFVIAQNGIQVDELVTIRVNYDVLFIEKNLRIRRCLTRTRPVGYKGNQYHYKLLKGGIKQITPKTSTKRNICRVKPEGMHSNHPKQWIYKDNGFAARVKQKSQPYGGTKIDRIHFNNEYHTRTAVHSSSS